MKQTNQQTNNLPNTKQDTRTKKKEKKRKENPNPSNGQDSLFTS